MPARRRDGSTPIPSPRSAGACSHARRLLCPERPVPGARVAWPTPAAGLLPLQEFSVKLTPFALVPLAFAVAAWPVDKPDAVGLMLIGLLALGLSSPNALDLD
jgi:hypothetical protein